MPRLEHYAADGPIYFYGGSFSSFASRDVLLPPPYQTAEIIGDLEPVLYENREEYYQAAKAIDRQDHDWVLGARPLGTWKVKERGQHVNLREDWERIKYAVMLRCVWHEVMSHPRLLGYLDSTGDRLIAEDSPTDYIWGIRDESGGMTGMNLLGLAWMHVRFMMRVWRDDAAFQLSLDHLDESGWVRDTEVMDLLRAAEPIFVAP